MALWDLLLSVGLDGLVVKPLPPGSEDADLTPASHCARWGGEDAASGQTVIGVKTADENYGLSSVLYNANTKLYLYFHSCMTLFISCSGGGEAVQNYPPSQVMPFSTVHISHPTVLYCTITFWLGFEAATSQSRGRWSSTWAAGTLCLIEFFTFIYVTLIYS